MNIWQIIVIALYMLSLGMYLALHGKPKAGTYNFGSAVVAFGIMFFALYKGGFFS